MLGNKRKIFLIGPMGSGKTAVGKALARLLRLPFRDSDQEIVTASGVDIPYIFDKEGEAGFREREAAAIAQLTALPSLVLATGGGVVLRAENRQHLAERGCVVYLETALEELVSRVSRNQQRPLLRGVDPAVKLAELMQQREPLYREIADLCVATTQRRVKSVAEEIARIL